MRTLETWVTRVLADAERLGAGASEAELEARQIDWFADFFTLAGADPDDPALRERLVDLEGMSPELADAVLARMREVPPAG
jgi:hypothetical protein